MNFKKLFIFLLIICVGVSAISAEDGTFADLQTIIDDADEGTTIFLNESTFTAEDGEDPITIDKEITIDGSTDGTGTSTIDGASLGRLIYVDSATVTLKNIEFINGVTDEEGGAIFNDGGDLTVETCTFTDNTASQGGAIYSQEGTLTVTGSEFNDNKATDAGNAIYSLGDLTVTDSNIADKLDTGVAAIYLGDEESAVNFNTNSIDTLTTPIYNEGAEIASKTTLVVLKNETVDTAVGKTPKLTAVLMDDNENVIGSIKPVIFTIDGIDGEFNGNYDENEQAFVAQGPEMTEEGEFPVTGEYELASDLTVKDGLLNVAEATVKATELTIEINDSVFGDAIEGSITLKDEDGNGVTGNVAVTVNGNTKTVNVENGAATFTIDELLNAGQYTAEAKYEGEEDEYEPSNATTTFTVSKIKPSMTVSVEQNAIIKINMDKPVTGTVSVTIAGQTYDVQVTNGAGELNIGKLEDGEYAVEAVFAGNTNYEGANAETTAVIVTPEPTPTPEPSNNTNNSAESAAKAVKKADATALETGNPVALLLLALFVIPVRRILKK